MAYFCLTVPVALPGACSPGGLSRYFRCFLIGEPEAVQQVYNPLGRLLHTERGLYSGRHAPGIRVDVPMQFLAQGSQLDAVNKPPIAFVAVLQKFIDTAVKIGGTVTVCCGNVFSKTLGYVRGVIANAQHQDASHTGIVGTTGQIPFKFTQNLHF